VGAMQRARKAGTRLQKGEKEAKVSLVKRMEAKKENYIEELECSRGVMVLRCWYAA